MLGLMQVQYSPLYVNFLSNQKRLLLQGVPLHFFVHKFLLFQMFELKCIFQADNLVFKDRKLNIGPAIRKQVCMHHSAVCHCSAVSG